MAHMTMAPFALWLTGLPASGKSSIVARLVPKLASMNLTAEVLESDAVRRILTPEASYSNRTLMPDLLEVSVECPIQICMERDKKGTYRRGLQGESSTVPGLQEPYEAPLSPDLIINTTELLPDAAADHIVALIRARRQS
ncbi:MAG: adenylyl-sulfate kinase [Nitrospira sp. NTP1]|nr:adenylyl-sulfate kinase [Nitrospira sp. NTP1]